MLAEIVLNVASWIPRSAANGPGDRFVLWLQGCPLQCPGCWNTDMWSFEERKLLSVRDALTMVLATTGIEGVTLSGGEPLVQAEALLPLLRGVREAGLSVMAFTGYELDELVEPAQRSVLDLADIVVSERFDEALACDDLPWRGSRNQQVRFLTERYSERDFREVPVIEVHISPEETVITGFPGRSRLEGFFAGDLAESP